MEQTFISENIPNLVLYAVNCYIYTQLTVVFFVNFFDRSAPNWCCLLVLWWINVDHALQLRIVNSNSRLFPGQLSSDAVKPMLILFC